MDTANEILKTLEKEGFRQWYEGRFADYIQDSTPTKDEILRDINELFVFPTELPQFLH